jgi:AcrR family transcriptional regulator
MSQVVRPYRGISAEDRRTQRRAKLVEAGLDVLGEEGLTNTTMTAVCARAGLTERYFYESFADRDQLLTALFDAITEETNEAALAALEAAPPDLLDRCRAAAGAIVDVLTGDPRKARAYVEAMGSEALRERRIETGRAYAALLAKQMRDLYGLAGKRHRAKLELATIVIIGGMTEATIAWIDGGLALSREEFVEECGRLCVAAAESIRSGT